MHYQKADSSSMNGLARVIVGSRTEDFVTGPYLAEIQERNFCSGRIEQFERVNAAEQSVALWLTIVTHECKNFEMFLKKSEWSVGYKHEVEQLSDKPFDFIAEVSLGDDEIHYLVFVQVSQALINSFYVLLESVMGCTKEWIKPEKFANHFQEKVKDADRFPLNYEPFVVMRRFATAIEWDHDFLALLRRTMKVRGKSTHRGTFDLWFGADDTGQIQEVYYFINTTEEEDQVRVSFRELWTLYDDLKRILKHYVEWLKNLPEPVVKSN